MKMDYTGIQKNSPKRLLPYFIIFSVFFLIIVSIFTLTISYKNAHNEAKTMLYEQYNYWLSDQNLNRNDTYSKDSHITFDYGLIQIIYNRISLAENENIPNNKKIEMLDHKRSLMTLAEAGIINIDGNNPSIDTLPPSGEGLPPLGQGSRQPISGNLLFVDASGRVLFSDIENQLFTKYHYFELLDKTKSRFSERIYLNMYSVSQNEIDNIPHHILSKPVTDPIEGDFLGFIVYDYSLIPPRENLKEIKVEMLHLSLSGVPLVPLKNEKVYRSASEFEDWLEIYSSPLKNPYADSLKDETNIKFIEDLINSDDSETLLLTKGFYKNYINQRVFAAGAINKDLGIILLLEIPLINLLAPYGSNFLMIFSIIFLSLTIFTIFMNHMDLLRLKALDSNPLTHLPGNNKINFMIQKMLDQKTSAAVVYADLDNFKAYNDLYGFSKGDQIIKYTAEVLGKVLNNRKEDFCGHIGGDDFIFIVDEKLVEKKAQLIIEEFDKGIVDFYSEEDKKRGSILSVSRNGDKQNFPLMTISLAGIKLNSSDCIHFIEVSNRCADLKKLAKSSSNSVFVQDRRKS